MPAGRTPVVAPEIGSPPRFLRWLRQTFRRPASLSGESLMPQAPRRVGTGPTPGECAAPDYGSLTPERLLSPRAGEKPAAGRGLPGGAVALVRFSRRVAPHQPGSLDTARRQLLARASCTVASRTTTMPSTGFAESPSIPSTSSLVSEARQMAATSGPDTQTSRFLADANQLGSRFDSSICAGPPLPAIRRTTDFADWCNELEWHAAFRLLLSACR